MQRGIEQSHRSHVPRSRVPQEMCVCPRSHVPLSPVPRNCAPRSHRFPDASPGAMCVPRAVSPGVNHVPWSCVPSGPGSRAAAAGSKALLGACFFPGRLQSLFSSIPPVHPPSSVILVPFPKGNKVSSNTVPTRKAKAPPTPLFPSSFGFRVMCPMTKQA